MLIEIKNGLVLQSVQEGTQTVIYDRFRNPIAVALEGPSGEIYLFPASDPDFATALANFGITLAPQVNPVPSRILI